MPTKKRKTKTKKIDRKSTSAKLAKIKFYRMFRNISFVLISIFIVVFIVIGYRNDMVGKIKEKITATFNRNVYKNTCINIQIKGVEKANSNFLNQKIDKFCKFEDKYDLNILKFEIMDDPWIKNLSLRRSLLSGLKIEIEEYLPFAIWKDGNNYHLIDENGKIIDIGERERKSYYSTLMVIVGEGSKEEIYSLFNLLSSNPSLFSKIKIANRIGKRRWDLTLRSGVIIKMPEENIVDAWFRLDKILSIPGSEIDTKIIDLRNPEKTFIESK